MGDAGKSRGVWGQYNGKYYKWMKTVETEGLYLGSTQKFAFKWLRTLKLGNKVYLSSDWEDVCAQYLLYIDKLIKQWIMVQNENNRQINLTLLCNH